MSEEKEYKEFLEFKKRKNSRKADRPPLPVDCVAIGEHVSFTLLGKAERIQETMIEDKDGKKRQRGYVVILVGLRWIENAMKLIDQMDRKTKQDISVIFENKMIGDREVRGMQIIVLNPALK